MTAQTFLGIDAGGTHTDAVLCGPEGILAGAKAPTCHEDLPSSVRAALAALEKALEEDKAAAEEEEIRNIKLPKSEELTTNLGELFKNLKF